MTEMIDRFFDMNAYPDNLKDVFRRMLYGKLDLYEKCLIEDDTKSISVVIKFMTLFYCEYIVTELEKGNFP